MIKEAYGTGPTIDSAKEDAIAQLGLSPEDDYQFEIIDLPHKKTLGIFGGNPAKVRVFIDDGADDTEIKSEQLNKNVEKTEKEKKVSSSANVSDDDKTVAYLKEILKNLGVKNYSVDASLEDDLMTLVISGDNMGVAIGRRGETLDALQYLCSIIANQDREKFLRVVVDTGNYREKRAQTLESLAKNMAAKVKRMGKNQMLEPMNPYERRIIHTTIQDIDGISSWSVGEGSGRRVVIGRKRGEGSSRRPSQTRTSSRQNRMESGVHQNKDDLGSAPLYGRIDK